MRFEWDEVKNRSNQRKHGISFEDAAYIFVDPFYVSTRERIEDGEERWQTLGRVRGPVVVMVAHLLLEQGTEITIRIISARRANRQEGDAMKKKVISYTLETLPPMSARREAKLARLASKPDAEIDYSDIPALSEEQWKQAGRGEFFRPQKRQITARLDADVLEWLRANGKGYQSRMNAILRRDMLSAKQG